jgi:hypothetical protein
MYSAIKEDFMKVVEYSQGIPQPHVEKLFDDWMEAKRDFIEAWGGKLIYEWPEKVSFELGAKEKELRLKDFCTMVRNTYGNSDLADFIEENKDGFFSNQVLEDYDYCGTKVPKGMKLLRAFKFFESNQSALENLQNAASMIIQEDKIEGTLCLSVHPLDFLSTSENNHNWRSCHALDGEYRAGNLSHMIDKATIICYLKSNREEVLPNFPTEVKWNSKKWRVLFYFSEQWDMVFAGRQYPFTTETGLDFVKNKVFPKAQLGEFSHWTDKKYRDFKEGDIATHFSFSYVPVVDGILKLNELMINEPGSLQFNDVLSSSCYDALYAYRQREGFGGIISYYPSIHHTHFKIGGRCTCMRCGKAPIEITESFMCNDCELEYGDSDDDMFAYCPCCGSRYFYDDGIWVEGAEECVCPNCADSQTLVCDCCGERYYKDDLVYSRKHDAYYCGCCADDMDNIRENLKEDFD